MIEVKRQRVYVDGFFGGLFAGGIFAAVQTLVAAASGGRPVGVPWNLFAAVIFGPDALEEGYGVGTFLLGMVFHFVLAGLFGTIYAFGVARLGKRVRDSYVAQALLGIGFGFLLWLVNIRLIAQGLFPWFTPAQLTASQLLTHLFAYGLPLGWFLCLRVRDYEVPGVHRARHKYQTADGGPEEVKEFRRDLEDHRKDLRRTPDEERS